uniref:adhesion G-protein coupled receptor G6-like isoform X2 n=1 Tax=Myxine glutinosa TaxID=7769 RepID=UPI00358EE1C4
MIISYPRIENYWKFIVIISCFSFLKIGCQRQNLPHHWNLKTGGEFPGTFTLPPAADPCHNYNCDDSETIQNVSTNSSNLHLYLLLNITINITSSDVLQNSSLSSVISTSLVPCTTLQCKMKKLVNKSFGNNGQAHPNQHNMCCGPGRSGACIQLNGDLFGCRHDILKQLKSGYLVNGGMDEKGKMNHLAAQTNGVSNNEADSENCREEESSEEASIPGNKKKKKKKKRDPCHNCSHLDYDYSETIQNVSQNSSNIHLCLVLNITINITSSDVLQNSSSTSTALVPCTILRCKMKKLENRSLRSDPEAHLNQNKRCLSPGKRWACIQLNGALFGCRHDILKEQVKDGDLGSKENGSSNKSTSGQDELSCEEQTVRTDLLSFSALKAELRKQEFNACAVALALKELGNDSNLSKDSVQLIADILQEMVWNIPPNLSPSLARVMLQVYDGIIDSNIPLIDFSTSLLQTLDHMGMVLSLKSIKDPVSSKSIALAVTNHPAGNATHITFITGDQNKIETTISSGEVDAVSGQNVGAEIRLPPSLLDSLSANERENVSKFQFALFKNTHLFLDNGENLVVAVSVGNLSISGLTENVSILFSHRTSKQGLSSECFFWNYALNGGKGNWSSDGCQRDLQQSTSNSTLCFCNHLTHFGILMTDISPESATDREVLTYITYIGCGISSCFLAITIILYTCFRHIRQEHQSSILVQTCLALLTLNITFLLDHWIGTFKILWLCVVTAAVLHFCLLASFSWMAIQAFHLYMKLIRVFNTYIHQYILKLALFGWGLPALVVVLLLCIGQNKIYGYSPYSSSSVTKAEDFCWFTSKTAMYISVLPFCGMILILNTALFFLVMRQVIGLKADSRGKTIKVIKQVNGLFGLTLLLGLSWIFNLFAWDKAHSVFVYAAVICNSLQGTAKTAEPITTKFWVGNPGTPWSKIGDIVFPIFFPNFPVFPNMME